MSNIQPIPDVPHTQDGQTRIFLRAMRDALLLLVGQSRLPGAKAVTVDELVGLTPADIGALPNTTTPADIGAAPLAGYVQRPRFVRTGPTQITLAGGCAYEINGRIVSTSEDITYTVTGLSASAEEWQYLYIKAGTSGELTAADLMNSTEAPTWDKQRRGWYNASGDRCIFAFFNTGNGVVLDFTDGGRGLIYFESEQLTNVINTDVDTSWVTVQLLLPVFAQEAFVFFYAYGSGETKTYYWRRYGNTGNGSYLLQQVSGAAETLRVCVQSDAQGRGQIRSNVAGTNFVSVVQVGYTLPLRGI